MFKFAFAALLCSQAYGKLSFSSMQGVDLCQLLLNKTAYEARPNHEIDPHIIGGNHAAEGQFPFAVSLNDRSNSFFCGGALISNKYVVTAAHCVFSIVPKKIGAGSILISDQKLYDVEKVTIHPSYHQFTFSENDIALIKLKTPVPIGGNIQTINFPVTENLDNKNATAVGWGVTHQDGMPSSTLLYLTRPILKNRECKRRLNEKISDSQICLGSESGHGMCFGDSGSPLIYKGDDGKNYIAGIVSWGVPCAKGYPDVFTRVSSFAEWIKKNMV